MIYIAVVDDDQQITAMLEKFLRRNENYKVVVYNNPLTALNLA